MLFCNCSTCFCVLVRRFWQSRDVWNHGIRVVAAQAHDVVFVLFCIRSAAPCKMMMPAWVRWSKDVNEGRGSGPACCFCPVALL